MKKHIDTKICMLLAAATLLSACEGSDGTEGMDKGVSPKFTADISAAATRAIDGTWNADEIGVTMTAAEGEFSRKDIYTNRRYKTTASGTSTATFEPAGIDDIIYIQENNGAVTFAAYAPYQDAAGTVTVSDTKAANAGDQEAIDFIVATGGACSVADPTVNFQFSHIMSKLVLQFKVDDAQFSFADLTDAAKTTFQLSGLVHSGTVDLDAASTTFGTATASGNASAWDITSCNPADAGEVRTYSFILFPQDLSSSGMTISLNAGGVIFEAILSPDLRPGEETVCTLALKQDKLEVESCTIEPWTLTDEGEVKTGIYAIDLSTVTSDITIRRNVTLYGTSTKAVTINFDEGTSDIIFSNATFADNTQIRVNTNATISLIGTNSLSTSSLGISPMAVTGGTEDTPHTLTITGSDTDTLEIKTTERTSTGIKIDGRNSHLVISGGNISVSTERIYSSAIGCGDQGQSGNITITGGTVTASTTGSESAAIGGGRFGTSGNITISGGTVKATASGDHSVAIGGGYQGALGDIIITGGEVIAESGYSNAAAIGSSTAGTCGDIHISGSGTKVTATSPISCFYDIGPGGDMDPGGTSSNCGTVTVSDGATVLRNDGTEARIYLALHI